MGGRFAAPGAKAFCVDIEPGIGQGILKLGMDHAHRTGAAPHVAPRRSCRLREGWWGSQAKFISGMSDPMESSEAMRRPACHGRA